MTRRGLLLLSLLLMLAVSVTGCSKDEEPITNDMPPAASKEAGEARASESGGGQFNRQSDRN